MEIHEVRRKGIVHQIRHDSARPSSLAVQGAGPCNDKIAGVRCGSTDTRTIFVGEAALAICGWHRQLRKLP
jgi:hypothetical protein